jgi:hypothetical protein
MGLESPNHMTQRKCWRLLKRFECSWPTVVKAVKWHRINGRVGVIGDFRSALLLLLLVRIHILLWLHDILILYLDMRAWSWKLNVELASRPPMLSSWGRLGLKHDPNDHQMSIIPFSSSCEGSYPPSPFNAGLGALHEPLMFYMPPTSVLCPVVNSFTCTPSVQGSNCNLNPHLLKG